MYKKILTIILCVALCFSSLSFAGCKKEQSFTVTCVSGHEDATLYYGEEVQKVTNSNQIVEPIYIRDGYNFVGWNVSISRIKSSTTVVAQWKKYDIQVVFNANGGKDDAGNREVTMTVDSAKQLIDNAPQFKKTGHTLSWEPQLETITNSCVVNAVWTVNDYTLTFKDKLGQDFENNTLKIKYNQKLNYSDIQAPQVLEEKFAYWADEQGVAIDSGIIWDIDKNSTFIAVYVPQEDFVINYDLDGGKRQNGFVQRSYNKNTQINITDPTRVGYRFEGWQINGSDERYFADDITLEQFKINDSFADVSMKATWSIMPYTLNFDANGGQCSGQEQTFYYGYQIGSLPIPQKQNYQFIGWYYGDVQIKEGDIWEYAQDLTLSARYLAKYKVKFSLTASVATSQEQVECKIVKWGDIQVSSSLEDVEIILLEGQSLLSKAIAIMPVVDPIEEAYVNEYIFGNYWKYIDDQNTSYRVFANTIFNSQNFENIKAGDTIILVPHIKLAWTPNY